MNPASLTALMKGDPTNALVAATPGGIEAQEKQGQLDQANKQTLPINLLNGSEHFTAAGFVLGAHIDALWQEAVFPTGWKKVPTDHSMWTEIHDDQDHVRGTIFYKAAFYDQKAHASLEARFSVRNADEPRRVFVRDALGLVHHEITGLEKPDWDNPEQATAARAAIDAAETTLEAWLTEHFPDWENPTAHWNP